MISKTTTPKKYEVKIVREKKREREKEKKGFFFEFMNMPIILKTMVASWEIMWI